MNLFTKEYNKPTYIMSYDYNDSNNKTEKNNKKHKFGTRFCDELPEDNSKICVRMKIDGRNITLIGDYYKNKQVILNSAIGFFELYPNDEWVYAQNI